MQSMRVFRWGLSVLLAALCVVAVGCSSSKEMTGIKSPHPLIRKAEVARLGQAGEMAAYDDLVAILRTDPDRLVRSQAAFALGDLSEKYYAVAFTPLSEALATDKSVFVRAAAAKSLAVVADARAVGPLVATLRDRSRGEVRVRQGDRVVRYRACASDAARTSLEKTVGLSFSSHAMTAKDQREEIYSNWETWYAARRSHFPADRAFAAK